MEPFYIDTGITDDEGRTLVLNHGMGRVLGNAADDEVVRNAAECGGLPDFLKRAIAARADKIDHDDILPLPHMDFDREEEGNRQRLGLSDDPYGGQSTEHILPLPRIDWARNQEDQEPAPRSDLLIPPPINWKEGRR